MSRQSKMAYRDMLAWVATAQILTAEQQTGVDDWVASMATRTVPKGGRKPLRTYAVNLVLDNGDVAVVTKDVGWEVADRDARNLYAVLMGIATLDPTSTAKVEIYEQTPGPNMGKQWDFTRPRIISKEMVEAGLALFPKKSDSARLEVVVAAAVLRSLETLYEGELVVDGN